MDLSGLAFFGFLAAIIIVPQVLRHQERARLHETLRIAFERGQPVPPELIAALQGRRRPDYDIPPDAYAGWRPRPAAAPAEPPPFSAAAPEPPPFGAAAPVEPPPAAAPFVLPPMFSQTRRDLRRGVIWLGIGIGLFAAGVASYAGLYEVGGAQETLSMFAAFGSIPFFVGLTYLGLAWFARSKTKG